MDELELECGRAAARAAGNFNYDGFAAAAREKYDRIARAIIPIVRAAVLEEAAGVADQYGGREWFEVGNVVRSAARGIATAIRALKDRP